MSMARLLLGCIADDFTGATDLANNLVRAGMRVVQTIGVPDGAAGRAEVDAVVVALKSRTIAAGRRGGAVARGAALAAGAGREQIYFKYCSTFDSHAARQHRPGDRGADGRARRRLHDRHARPSPTTSAPSSRATCSSATCCSRESGMRHHPLTPMTDANLVRVLQAQTQRKVGLIDHARGRAGRGGDRARASTRLRAEGVGDRDRRCDHQRRPAAPRRRRCTDLPLVTAGSGLAIGLPANFGIARVAAPRRRCRRSRGCAPSSRAAARRRPTRQVRALRRAAAARRVAIDPLALGGAATTRSRASLAWADAQWPRRRRRCWSTATAGAGRGAGGAGAARRRATPARWSSARSRRSRAAWSSAACASSWWPAARPRAPCVQALGVAQLRDRRADRPRRAVVPRAAPARARRRLHLALKSGNFGDVDFFTQGVRRRSAGMNDRRAARRDLPRRPLAVRARLRARQRRQHQRAARRRLPDHADRRLPRHARAGARWREVDAQGEQTGGDRAPARRWRCTAASTRPTPTPRCVIHTHSHAPGRADAGRRVERDDIAAADHAVLRDEGRPRAADPLPPPGRPGGRPTRWRSDRAARERAARRSAR